MSRGSFYKTAAGSKGYRMAAMRHSLLNGPVESQAWISRQKVHIVQRGFRLECPEILVEPLLLEPWPLLRDMRYHSTATYVRVPGYMLFQLCRSSNTVLNFNLLEFPPRFLKKSCVGRLLPPLASARPSAALPGQHDGCEEVAGESSPMLRTLYVRFPN